MITDLRDRIGAFFTSDFTRNSAKLLTAHIGAQAIGLLVYPLLTRLYGADNFGLVNLFLSIGGVLTLFATAEYQYAIVIPKSERRAVACFQVGFLICLAVTLLILLSTLFSTPIAELFNAPQLADWYFLMPLFVFLFSLWALLNYWHTRHKNFTNISTFQLTQSVFGAGSKYTFGLIGFTGGGLIVSSVLALLLSVFISICGAFKKGLAPLFSFDKKECRAVAKAYINFPKYSLPRAVVNTFSGNLPILLLTPFFGLAEVGFFGMALTLAFRPISMISGSLNQVFFQRTAERVQNREPIMPFLKKFVRNTLFLLLPLFSLFYFVLPTLTEFILGNGWRITGEYIQVLLPWLLLSALVAPICYLSDIFQEQKRGLLFEIALAVCRTAGVLLGIGFDSFGLAIVGYSVGNSLVIFLQLIWYLRMAKKFDNSLQTTPFVSQKNITV